MRQKTARIPQISKECTNERCKTFGQFKNQWFVSIVAKPPRGGGLKKYIPRVCKGVFENTRIKKPANSYVYLAMRVELIVCHVRKLNPHVVSTFTRLARHLIIDECLFNGI